MEFATERLPALHASISVTCLAASMHPVITRVVHLALRAPNHASGAASTLIFASYPAVPPATGSCAISDAPNRSVVDTDVPVSVEKTALCKSSVTTVGMKM